MFNLPNAIPFPLEAAFPFEAAGDYVRSPHPATLSRLGIGIE
ncbi:hypothetical protein VCA_000906 [Vibrio albensis VL426]|nr:hypothetical protein VCA_000906 [Vibrio cholerae VL426]